MTPVVCREMKGDLGLHWKYLGKRSLEGEEIRLVITRCQSHSTGGLNG